MTFARDTINIWIQAAHFIFQENFQMYLKYETYVYYFNSKLLTFCQIHLIYIFTFNSYGIIRKWFVDIMHFHTENLKHLLRKKVFF